VSSGFERGIPTIEHLMIQRASWGRRRRVCPAHLRFDLDRGHRVELDEIVSRGICAAVNQEALGAGILGPVQESA
jgi:hypothetical protein